MKTLVCVLVGVAGMVLLAAAPVVSDVTAKQRYPWNGLVDITCKMTGINGATNALDFAVAAVMPDSGEVREVSHFWTMQGGAKSTDREVHTNGNYCLLWDAQADLGQVNYDNMVVRVTTVEGNSPKNPLWIGEKTADELAWGEWTMDIDAATNKVNAYNAGTGETTTGGGASLLSAASPKDRAYTLLLLEGALWCPDCKNTDDNLFLQQKFKTWAQENKVALVAIDLPSADDTASTAPCLLTTDKGLSYYTGAMASGASYLSRKMIDTEVAADILDRNWEIAQKLRLPSALKKNRPPVPSIFVLRNDGTVAGRIEYFGRGESPTDASNIDAHIERLNELLRQVDDPVEEANDFSQTTTEMIGPRTNVVNKTLSFVDAVDVYRLDPEKTANKRLVFTLSGMDNVHMQLKVIDDRWTIIDAASGLLSEGVSVEVEVEVLPTKNCFISVGYETEGGINYRAVDQHFGVANTDSTLCTYALKSDFVVQPTELAADNHIVVADEVNYVTVSLVSNQIYRITNLDMANETNLAALVPTNGPGAADCLYLAQVTGDVRLALTGPETEIQKWNFRMGGVIMQRRTISKNVWRWRVQIDRSCGVSETSATTFPIEEITNSCPNFVKLADVQRVFTMGEKGGEIKGVKVCVIDNGFAVGDQGILFRAVANGDALVDLTLFHPHDLGQRSGA